MKEQQDDFLLELFKIKRSFSLLIVIAEYIATSHFCGCSAVLSGWFHGCESEQYVTETQQVALVYIKRSGINFIAKVNIYIYIDEYSLPEALTYNVNLPKYWIDFLFIDSLGRDELGKHGFVHVRARTALINKLSVDQLLFCHERWTINVYYQK